MIPVLRCPVCLSKENTIIFRRQNFEGKKCDKCGLIYISPRPEDTGELYKDNSSSSPSRYYSLSKDSDYRTFTERLELIEQYALKGAILDIGCSVGTMLETARSRGWKKTVGIEPNPVAAKECRDKNITVINDFFSESHALEMQNMFDSVYLGDVIEHLPDPTGMINMAKLVLKHAGVLVIVTPDYESITARTFQIKPNEHILYFTQSSLDHLLVQNGFKTELLKKTTRERSLKALKYSTTSDKKLAKYLISIFSFIKAGAIMNYLIRLFVRDELIGIYRKI